jgi:predicted RNase H-like HicB family nuclease
MTRYIAIIDYADGMYGASFPDVPGCTGQAASLDEVVSDAADALAEWVADELAEGRKAPRPRSAEELLRLDDVRHAIGSGGVLASVPLLQDSGEVARANISMDAGLLAQVDETARRVGLTRSAFLAAAARDRIKATP